MIIIVHTILCNQEKKSQWGRCDPHDPPCIRPCFGAKLTIKNKNTKYNFKTFLKF